MSTKVIPTHTGKIYYDPLLGLEFLTVGDYGKENNIKANFLGLTKKIEGVPHHDVDLKDKWVATISSQKGCPMKCTFCDVHKYGFFGNASLSDLEYQIRYIIEHEDVRFTNRFNVHYARMGEPTWNPAVLDFTKNRLDALVRECGLHAVTIHPVVSTMMPKGNDNLVAYLQRWCEIKNELRHGEAGLQLSINSTSDEQRAAQFAGKSLDLGEIAAIAASLPMPVGRKYTLNFAVTEATILDADVLTQLFDPNKFIVKLTPIHQTKAALEHHYDITTSYDDYSVYDKFEQPLLDKGWDVIVFVPSKEEDSDRITCGNALISYELKPFSKSSVKEEGEGKDV